MNFKILLILTLSILQSIPAQKMFQNWNVCGRNTIKSEADCFIANLGSGFVCCHVTGLTNQADTCVLVGVSVTNTVEPPVYTGPGKIKCSNSASFMSISLISMISFVLFLVL